MIRPIASRPVRHALFLALAAALPAAHAADDTDKQSHHLTELSTVKVTASPLQNDAESLARPVAVLTGEELDARKGATLGDTISRMPGVQTT